MWLGNAVGVTTEGACVAAAAGATAGAASAVAPLGDKSKNSVDQSSTTLGRKVRYWHLADKPVVSVFVRFWTTADKGIFVRDGLSANDL